MPSGNNPLNVISDVRFYKTLNNDETEVENGIGVYDVEWEVDGEGNATQGNSQFTHTNDLSTIISDLINQVVKPGILRGQLYTQAWFFTSCIQYMRQYGGMPPYVEGVEYDVLAQVQYNGVIWISKHNQNSNTPAVGEHWVQAGDSYSNYVFFNSNQSFNGTTLLQTEGQQYTNFSAYFSELKQYFDNNGAFCSFPFSADKVCKIKSASTTSNPYVVVELPQENREVAVNVDDGVITFDYSDLSTKLNKNQGVENAGKVLVVGNDGEIVLSAEQSGGKSKWHLVLDEIMKKEDAFDRYRMRLGLIKKSVGGLVDITDCAQLKAHIKNLVLGDDMDGIAEADRTIIYDDKVWQQSAVEHNVNNPYGQFGKIRWSDKPLFGWRQTSDPVDAPVNIENNGFRLPLEYNLNPQPGEAQVQVDQSFVISEDGKMAFRIEADGIKQRAIIQQAPHTPIANVPSTTPGANAALQFTLNNQQIFGPLFDGSNLNYYTGAYNYTNITCPQVADLPASAQEGDYCYNTTDNKYYVYGAGGSWLDISTQTNTPHINFVAELPAVDVANVGELYVLNSEVGFVNSIQTLQYSYNAGSVANSAINSLKYGNWYNVACPVSTTPPENPATTPFYFEPNGQKYYAYSGGNWVDITASITQGASLPSSYNNGNFFVFTGTFGQANSLYVAVVEEFDSNNQALYTVGGSLDIHLLLQPDNAGYVDVNNVKVLATYNSSNLQWTIKVITITGSNLIGTYIGTEAEAQDYIKDIIATVAKTALGEIYTFIQSDGTTAIYDEQGTWKGGADGTISDSGQFLSWDGDKNYTRDTTHDTTAENWLRLANTVNIYFTGDSSKNGKVSAQQLPNLKGVGPALDNQVQSTPTGVFYYTDSVAYDASSTASGGQPRLAFDASRHDATCVDNGKVQVSGVGYSLYVVVKDHDEVALRKQFANSVNPNASNVLVGELTTGLSDEDYSANIEIFVKQKTVGELVASTKTTCAANFMYCDGRAISRTTYSELFAEIGTKYGPGDGTTTFNIPDMRGRVAQGKRIDNDAPYLEDGAPDITGTTAPGGINGLTYVTGISEATGCFASSQAVAGNTMKSTGYENRTCIKRLTFKASDSSDKYGASDVIQPKAAQVYWFICVSQVPVENSGS